MKPATVTAILAAAGFALATAGFFVGRLTTPPTPIPDGWLDISKAPPDTQALLKTRGALDFLGQIIHVENGEMKLYDSSPRDTPMVMPAGYPSWPSELSLSAPRPDMHWIEAKLAGGDALSASRDNWTVVNLWASWCAPCLAELPDVDRLAAILKGKVGVFAINLDTKGGDTAASAAALFTSKGITTLTPLYAQTGIQQDVLSAAGLGETGPSYPMSVIYAPGGKPFAFIQDSSDTWNEGKSGWSGPELIAFFENLSALPAPSQSH